MVKRIGRRFVSLLLTFVTILTLLPAMTLPALAAVKGDITGFPDKNISLSFSGNVDNPWQIKSADIIGQVKSVTDSSCNTTDYNSTLTITNNKTTTATLFFDYTATLSSGVIRVGSETEEVQQDGKHSFTKELAAGGKIEVYIKSGSDKANTTITISNIKLIAHVNATVTFLPAENGSYTVDEKTITKAHTNTQNSMKPYLVEATPNEGYQFRDWYNMTTGKTISKEKRCALNVEEKCEITARFVSANIATFLVGSDTFIALDEATEYAKENAINTIMLRNNGTLLQGNYTIPAGMTLLIPYDATGTVSNGEPKFTKSYDAPSTFRELTMTKGSTLTVNGELVVGGVLSAAGQGDGFNGTPSGPHGAIIMPEGSAIVVNGKLYAYGYISGPKDSTGKYTSGFNCGTVTVNSGGEVHEAFQIKDFRGGTVTLTPMLNNEERVFLFSQYFVQNIEVPLTIRNGAHDYAYSGVQVKLLGTQKTGKVSLIGDGGLFNITDGYITRTYVAKAPEDSALLNDHVYYDVYGKIAMNSIDLKIAGHPISAKNYDLPINGNLSLRLFENESGGSKAVVNTPLALLPGFELYISKNSELTAAAPMYVYDAAEWYQRQYVNSTNYNKGNPVLTYTKASKGPTPKRAPSAQIDVNGTLTTSTGGVYTTKTGANIYSSEGTGKFIQSNAPDSAKKTYQYVQSDKFYDIPITPAQLQNDAGDPTQTKDARAGDTFTYCKCQECGGGTWVKNLMVAEFNTKQYGTLQEAANDANGAPYVSLLHSTTEDINAKNDLYLDLHGYTVTGDFKMGGYTLYGMDSTTDDYVGTNAGKIVGSVVPYNKITYQTGNPGDAYKRYVGILREESGTPTLSFHRFNISVTGYRFELAAPQCALIFCGKFQGDRAAKDYLKSLGFTLTGNNGTVSKSSEMPKALGDKFVTEEGDAYLFELYLIRSFEKNSPDNPDNNNTTAYTEEFFATAQATFKNGGTQDSGTKEWSFQKAWEDALKPNSGMEEKDQEILRKFLKEFGINIQVE